uniref:Uncharacterized protein n=1 Tax=Glossina palpalis gambiensis TaxID=67801 RepID=A0A1B0B7J7_9MUSC
MEMLRLSSTTSMTYEVLSYKQVPSVSLSASIKIIVDKSLHMHHMCVDKLQNYSEQLTTHVGLSAYRFQTDFLHGPVPLSSARLKRIRYPGYRLLPFASG